MEDGLWIPDQIRLLATLHVAQIILFGIKQVEALKQLVYTGVQWMLIYFSFLSLKIVSVKYTLKILLF